MHTYILRYYWLVCIGARTVAAEPSTLASTCWPGLERPCRGGFERSQVTLVYLIVSMDDRLVLYSGGKPRRDLFS